VSAPEKPVYAVIYGNGRAETMKEGSTYWSVLSDVYRAYQSAGGDWNRPVMLLANGKVVVESGLADKAWRYGQDLYSRQQRATADCHADHAPAWLADVEGRPA
jgi:hypothetical protein